MSSASLFTRAYRKTYRTLSLALHRDEVTGLPFSPRPDLQRIGTAYGGWVVPVDLLSAASICYCVGCGEDVSFDLGLIERFGCDVYSFDPTPRGIQHVTQEIPPNPKYHFTPVGLWDSETVLKFYAPINPAHDSYSALNLQHQERYVTGPVKRLRTMMQEHGHTRLDLLKIDIEGAEYKVLDSLIADKLDVRVVCVEYDEYFNPLEGDAVGRIRASLQALSNYGFRLVHARGMGNYTLVRP